MRTAGSDPPDAAWSWRDLTHPLRAAAAVVALVVSGVVSQMTACNIHEVGHVAVAIPLGWEVERIRWCAPGAGGVDYAHVGRWVGNLQGYSGGLAAALFLYVAYRSLFARKARPHRSPWWWAAGLGVVFWIGPQLAIAAMEGSAGPNEDYTELFQTRPAVFVPLLLGSALASACSYIWWWRPTRVEPPD